VSEAHQLQTFRIHFELDIWLFLFAFYGVAANFLASD